MADQQDLKDALSGVKDLASFDLRGADLSGHDFTGCNLDNCRLEKANLTGAILEACNLKTSKITHANLSIANLKAAQFGSSVFGVNFSHANLSHAKFSRCLFHSCNFDYAVLNDADFSNSRFRDGNTFSDTEYNSNTKFDNVQILRPMSRAPVFSNYEYSRGHLHARKSSDGSVNGAALNANAVNAEEINQETVSTPIAENRTKTETVGFKVGQRLAAQPVAYSAQLNELNEWMFAQLEWWESKKPNHDDAEWSEHYEFLKSATSTLSELSEAVASLSNEPKSVEIEQAGNKAIAAEGIFEKWITDFSGSVGSTGKSVGMLTIIGGVTCALSMMIGSEPTVTLGIVSAAVGGSELAENIGKTKGKS